MKIYKIALKNIGRNRRRSLLSASAVAVTAFAIVFLFSLIGGMLQDSEKNLFDYQSGMVRVEHSQFKKYQRLNPMHLYVENVADVVSLAAELPGYGSHSLRINFGGQIDIAGGEDIFNTRATAVDFSLEKDYNNLDKIVAAGSGEIPAPGSRAVVMGAALAQRLGVEIGDKFNIFSPTAWRGRKYFTLKVAAIAVFPLAATNNSFLLSYHDGAKLLQMPGGASQILIKIDDPTAGGRFASLLQQKLTEAGRDDLAVRDWYSDDNLMYSMIKMGANIYNIIAMFFFVLGSTVILNTTMMVIFERMREIGALGALGLKSGELVRLFFFESLFISMLGAFIGMAAGVALTLYFSINGIDFGAMMEGIDFGISRIIYPKLDFYSTLFVFIYASLVAALITIIPARRAGKVAPAEALRSQ